MPEASSSMGNSGTMIVTKIPVADLVLTNYAYCSSSDNRRFMVPGFGPALASIGSSMVLTLCPHKSIVDGLIALNPIQRRHARISTGDPVSVSRFVPPEKKFKLVLLTLDLEFVKARGKTAQLDAVVLGKQLQKRFLDQVFTMGQRATFEYRGTNYIFTVNQTLVEGQGDNENIDRGMVSKETYIVFKAASNSGIKIMNQREAASSNIFKQKDFDLQKLGIGGLAEQLQDIFRRAFASQTRGSTRDGTGVHDGIVNQLRTKIDGVESLNNVLLIGMTNRKGLIDEALLRPGHLGIQIEIGLPDEKGRLENFRIYTSKMKENSFLAADVNLEELAAWTKNFSGAEIEGVVNSAASFALKRKINPDDLTKPLDEENIKVTMDDFLCALEEVKPALGVATDNLERCRLNGMVDCGERHKHILDSVMLLVKEVKWSKGSPLMTCLLEGPSGSGKTSMAATVGIESKFPFVEVVSAESMIGLSESRICAAIVKVFEDAYKSPLSIIILDDIERLLEFVVTGPQFSNLISETLLALLKKPPPKGSNLLVIGTTSKANFLQSLGIRKAFGVSYHVPTLGRADTKKVLQQLSMFAKDDLDAAVGAIDEIPIKKLFMLVEMAAQGQKGNSAEAIYSGKEKININLFFDCLSSLTGKI